MKKTISLTENRQFRALYSRGRNAARKTMAVYVRPNRQKTVSRLGLTVSVKLGNAVVRNRVRRRIKEAYRLSEDAWKGGFDIVIVARHAAVNASFDTLSHDIRSLFRQLGVMKESHD